MNLNQTAEYALRAMTYLAIHQKELPLKSKDLAQRMDIPPHYLSKIMRKLVTSGLLTSQKGHGGGFEFALPLGKIKFMDILEAVDYQVTPNSCVFGWGQCNPDKPCPLHNAWSELNRKFLGWAKNTTLAKVKKNGGYTDWRREAE